MFITEAQLALYKYQAGGKYFGKTMANIFATELLHYAEIHKFKINEEIQWFLNRRISNDVWKIYFNDDSVAYIKLSDSKVNSREIQIQTFDFNISAEHVFN